MIKITHKGNFEMTTKYFNKILKRNQFRNLEELAQEGVKALSSATPRDTGLTANSWKYEIIKKEGLYIINWYNEHIVNDVQIAIILQYGHGTQNGGYVEGRDYINPAIRPIFDRIANEAWREVTS